MGRCHCFALLIFVAISALHETSAWQNDATTIGQASTKLTDVTGNTVVTVSTEPTISTSSSTDVTANTTGSTGANTTLTTTTPPAIVTLAPDSASNCTLGLPIACFITPEYNTSKRCQCLENTTFIYNETRCDHLHRMDIQWFGEDIELTLRCNYTLNKCYKDKPKKKVNADDEMIDFGDVEGGQAARGFAIGQRPDCWVPWVPQAFERNGSKEVEVVYPIPPTTQFREKCDVIKHIIGPARDFNYLGEVGTTFLVLTCYMDLCGKRNRLPMDNGRQDAICTPQAPDPYSLRWKRKWCAPYETNLTLMEGENGCEPLPPCEPDGYTDRDYLPALTSNYTQDYTMCEILCPHGGIWNKNGRDQWNRTCRRIPALDADRTFVGRGLKWCDDLDSLRRDPPMKCIPLPFCLSNGTTPDYESNYEANPFWSWDCVVPLEGCTPNQRKIFYCNENSTATLSGEVDKPRPVKKPRTEPPIYLSATKIAVISLAAINGVYLLVICLVTVGYFAFRKKSENYKDKTKTKTHKQKSLSKEPVSKMRSRESSQERNSIEPIRKITPDRSTALEASETGHDQVTTQV